MKTLRIWLDDVRKAPVGYTHWVKNYDECIRLLESRFDEVEFISLDHDLAEEHYPSSSGYMENKNIDRSKFKERTGYDVLEWMHEHNKWVPEIAVHTMNTAGARDMLLKCEMRAPEGVKWYRSYEAYSTYQQREALEDACEIAEEFEARHDQQSKPEEPKT